LLNLLLLIFHRAADRFFSGGIKKLEDKTALILDFKGALVEQHSGNAREALLAEAQGNAKKSTQLRDILSVLDSAAKDDKIHSAVLLLDDMGGAGFICCVKSPRRLTASASGKPVIAWGSNFDQRQYFLAAQRIRSICTLWVPS
jgi:protease-4